MCTLMSSKGILEGFTKQFKDKKLLIVDPKSNPKAKQTNANLFGCQSSDEDCKSPTNGLNL